ncbi:conserved hypothetical protein [Theileria equi strain WA]|uniref:RING-type domain-containing protein n=1 Tax=Theileria equi strain WA TaxID=1537102 RepID=L1LGC5_THEEQ|nr:conserved hypothetical protein [Theileria equi strain WA]EKX74319.1 conserved hypothetical protein [Theileria equi strain WA]|eukprot:XP_004833771.1 conserved hypothetical protein [Theileria equi strain WA]
MGNALKRDDISASNRRSSQRRIPEIEQQIIHTFSSQSAPSVEQTTVNHRFIPNLSVKGLQCSKSTINFKPDSLSVQPVDNQFLISFRYDAEEEYTVTFRFGQCHEGLKNGVPCFSKPSYKTPPIKLDVGNDVFFRMEVKYLKDMKGCTLESCSFTEERKYVPILIVLESLKKDFSYYIMSGLKFDDIADVWNIIITKRRIVQGDYGYQIQEVYGLTQSKFNRSDEIAENGETKRCAICLDTWSDTILIPCRHLCLCFSCANKLQGDYGKCPMCRTPVSRIVHIY